MRRLSFALPLALVLVASCSGGDSQPGTFTVQFPTVATAIATLKQTSGVEVSVFPTSFLDAGAAAAAGACQTLVEDSLTGNLSQTPVAKTQVLTACDIENGQGSLPVPYGSYAFLAVAQDSSNTPFLIGCAEQTISKTNSVVVIPMALATATASVPTTTCTMLSQACPSGAGC